MRGEELVEPATREAMKRKLKNIERDVDRDSAAALVEVKSRKGKKQLAVWIDPELHREIKVMAAEDGLTIEQFIIDAVIQERKSRG
jgi:predicted HicB family RNase H-like nuclease